MALRDTKQYQTLQTIVRCFIKVLWRKVEDSRSQTLPLYMKIIYWKERNALNCIVLTWLDTLKNIIK